MDLLGNTFAFGGNEGVEIAKAWVVRAGTAADCWNDQPWFSSQLLNLLLQGVGDDIGKARWTVPAMVASMLACIVRVTVGAWSAATILAACIFWLLSPGILHLNISLMLEVPCLALASIALAWGAVATGHGGWLRRLACAMAGVAMAMACQVKLVAALYLPALVLLVAWPQVRNQTPKRSHVIPQSALPVGILLASLSITFALIATRAPYWDWDLLWHNHARSAASPTVRANEALHLSAGHVLQHVEGIAGVVLGTAALWRQGRRREAASMLMMLAVPSLAHAVQRPWWYWYELHVALPKAVLAGHGVISCMRWVLARGSDSLAAPGWARPGWLVMAWCMGFWGYPRLESQACDLREVARQPMPPEVPLLRALARAGHRTFTAAYTSIYPWAGMVPCPGGLLTASKRFWGGEPLPVYYHKIWLDRPDVVQLKRGPMQRHFLAIPGFLEEYRPAYLGAATEVWVRCLPSSRGGPGTLDLKYERQSARW